MENRVGFWLRVGASVIDIVIVMVLALVARGLIASLFPDQLAVALGWQLEKVPPGAPGRGFAEGMATMGFAAGFLGLAYGLFEGLAGWSPGKLLLSLRIVDEGGQRAPLGKLLARYAIKQSASILALVALFLASKPLSTTGTIASVIIFLGFFLVLTRSKQALHDKIAGTAILRKADVGVAATAQPTPAASL
jgi:uncharacterized RDD family membrane protein YckC